MTNGAYIGIHATLWSALAIGGLMSAGDWTDPPVALRDTPLNVAPQYDYDVVVSDEQLVRILRKLKPPFEGKDTKINHMDHALRFWTAEAKFDPENKKTLSGEQMRRLLTDHRLFTKLYGPKAKPLLTDADVGVGTAVQMGNTTSSHVDHTVACLAEAGTPLDYPVFSPTQATTYRAMVEHCLNDFSLNQTEYEWTALTFALFLPPTKSWRTSEGQAMSFDLLARRIMRERQPLGVCFGNHRLHTLTVFLRVDDQEKILSDEARQEVMDYLMQQTVKLVSHQHPDGFWNRDWPLRAPEGAPSKTEGDRLSDRILATGHALEWWALAPRELHPPRPVLASAGQWLVREIDALSDEDTLRFYTFLTHAGRALSLWRGRTPADVIAEFGDSPPQKPAVVEPKDDSDEPTQSEPTTEPTEPLLPPLEELSTSPTDSSDVLGN